MEEGRALKGTGTEGKYLKMNGTVGGYKNIKNKRKIWTGRI